jgi:CRP/FNR family transcriptional regulator, cyclic AMP receptor protein
VRPSTPFDTLAPGSFLASLADPDREALLANGHRREWPRGGVLVRIGDRADTAIVLLGGLVKIHKPGTLGEEVILGMCGPGDLLGEISAVRDAVRSATATALQAVHALVLGVPDLRAFLNEHPRATLALLDLALGRLHVADERRVEFATAGSLVRVSSRLIELAERFGSPRQDGAIEICLPINQEELASWSASSKESTARALRTLRELGLIETARMRLTVLDLGQLRLHAGRA